MGDDATCPGTIARRGHHPPISRAREGESDSRHAVNPIPSHAATEN